ncbi:MAG: SIR2 family protein [Blastocatellia bacterium]|nr:SIR2 family protein [Blastocatellia bacterium]
MPIIENTNLQEFIELYKNSSDKIVFFIGAGLSMPLFPSWAKLLKDMVDTCYSNGKLMYEKNELMERIDKGEDYLEIADVCANALGTSGYRQILERYFDKEFTIDIIPKAYKNIFNLPVRTLITTNYDRIPEIGGGGSYRSFTNKQIPEALRAIEENKKVVIKLHGDILSQESIILTLEDFNKIIHRSSTAANFLKSIFSIRRVLFLGFSLDDPHLDLILSSIKTANEGINVIHYALLPIQSRFKIDSLEKKYPIKILSYTPLNNSHPEVEEFVRRLSISEADPVQETILSIDNIEDIILMLKNGLVTLNGYRSFFVDYDEGVARVYISVAARGRTEFEFQKELLAIVNHFSFLTTKITDIYINFYLPTAPNKDFESFYPISSTCILSYDAARKFSKREIDERTLWSGIVFYAPSMVGTSSFHLMPKTIPFIGAAL